MNKPVRFALIAVLLLVGATLMSACDPSSADHRAWVHSMMWTDAPGPLPDALEGEIMLSAKWTTTGVGSVYGQSTDNLRLDTVDENSNFCGSHGPLNTMWTDGPCQATYPEYNPPWGAMSIDTHRQYNQDLAAPPISYSKYYSITLHARIRVEHRSGNNPPILTATCDHDGTYYGSSGFTCDWAQQY